MSVRLLQYNSTIADWGISQQYVPYRPSYDALIERIEALEAGA